MSKVLITGDVHIHDYRNHNLFDDPHFRLKQFDKLAQRIVSLADDVDAEALVVAGDFLHVANPRPYIVNTAFNFLDIVSEKMDVYLTHGQHDYDSRTSMDGQHTLLTLCNRIPRVSYVHRNSRTIGGKKFYFLGWEPNWSELLKSVGSCDVLIGHAQPRDVRVGQRGMYMYGGEIIPDSGAKFDIAFLGDIHYHQNRDRWVIPGTPIQHSFNDNPDVGVILFDTTTLEWERIPTILPRHWEFLQLIISDEPNEDPYVVSRPKTSTETTRFQSQVERSLDTMAVIQGAVEEAGLEELHAELMGSVCKDVRTEVDLNFSLEQIKIQNFRSISDFEWENISEGVKLISGRNGTGKSSLINAILFALIGEGSARNLTQNGKKNMFVEVTFLYGQLRHTIRRGWATGGGKLQYSINGEDVPAENQRALSQKVIENLPFLKFTDLFYHGQDRPGFLASYNYAARVDLVSRVLGLKIVNELQQTALNKTVSVDNELAKLREKIASATSIVAQESLVDFSFMEMVNEGTETNLRELKEAIRKLLDDERKKHTETVKTEAILTSSITRTTTALSEAERKRQTVIGQTCYTCGQSLVGEKHQAALEEISSEIEQHRRDLNNFELELGELNICTDTLNNLEQRYESVSSKLSEVVMLNQQAKKIELLKISIDNAKKECILLEESITNIEKTKESLSIYRRLMDSNGPVMRSLLTSVSELLTSDTLRVRAHKQLVSGELRPDFGVDMKVSGQGWIAYDELSGGQKTVSDLTILEKLIRLAGGVGLLIFDETFKYLDNENLEVVVDLIKTMSCHSTFIVSHAEGFPYWDISVKTKLDKVGHTEYTMR